MKGNETRKGKKENKLLKDSSLANETGEEEFRGYFLMDVSA